MDQDRRHKAVTALVGLAASDHYLDRADAGRALASFAELPEAQESLLRLVLDGDDTFVTRVTAEALLRRQDAAGFLIVAEALASADDQHSTHIHAAVTAVFMVFASERDRALETCEGLSLHARASVRQGADELHQILADIRPVLFPQAPA